jgi:hypothetical protein
VTLQTVTHEVIDVSLLSRPCEGFKLSCGGIDASVSRPAAVCYYE